MKHFFLKLTITFFVLLCFSCSQKPAQIVNRSGNFYGKNNFFNKSKYSNPKFSADNSFKINQVEISEGDTLYAISKRYQIPLRDLIQENNLKPPYILKNGRTLIIPAPSYHIVQKGDTIYNISRSYNMNIDNLVELNDLKSPYTLHEGQKIRTTKSSKSTEITTNNLNSDIVEKPLNPLESGTNSIAPVTTSVAAVTPPVANAIPNVAEQNKEVAPKKIAIPNISEANLSKSNQFAWPVKGEVISKFGPKKGGLYNDGINIKAANGSKVVASEDGIVAYVGNELKGYGNLIIIKHSSGWITAYAHLSKTIAKRGQKVKKLDLIGEVGATGNVEFPQLYFGLRKGRDSVNPENYL
ncbi:MAG: LysM peptidoglycan-binding domain-containing protein [Pelagibacterales bacterium]|nr:LysM peptidoglycan-binding domain-containing protein [Pelagibacterales bacterium]